MLGVKIRALLADYLLRQIYQHVIVVVEGVSEIRCSQNFLTGSFHALIGGKKRVVDIPCSLAKGIMLNRLIGFDKKRGRGTVIAVFTVGAKILSGGFVPEVVNRVDCSANAGNPIILCNVGLGQPQPVSSLELDIPKICKEPLVTISVTFTANIFQFKKPVGIGNDVLKESIPKPGADLQGIRFVPELCG